MKRYTAQNNKTIGPVLHQRTQIIKTHWSSFSKNIYLKEMYACMCTCFTIHSCI